MDTCFLFSSHLNEEGCYSLKLNPDGNVIAPLAQRAFTEINHLQQDSITLVIETSIHASFFNLELPWLPEKKARAAIPYALEEKLAQPLDELHFAFDKTRYQNNHYLVAVISKQRMSYIMQLLAEKEIKYTAITLDWFALEAEEVCVNESIVLINTPHFKGALSDELAENYIKSHIFPKPLFFTDSQIQHTEDGAQNENSFTWIAQRIAKSKLMNLCQGEMQHGKQANWIKKSYYYAGALFVGWLVSLILVQAINLYFLNKHISQIDQQIAVIYHEFFPDSKQVISPRFRINQLLKGTNNEDQTRFWFLLNQFSKVGDLSQFTLEQIRYQNKILSITLVSPDFAALEQLENQLKKLQLKVRQTQASSREQHVIATLELT